MSFFFVLSKTLLYICIIIKNNIMKFSLKNRVLGGEMIDLNSVADSVTIWHQKKTDTFCMMLNAKVVVATKTWKPIQKKLDSINNLKEI